MLAQRVVRVSTKQICYEIRTQVSASCSAKKGSRAEFHRRGIAVDGGCKWPGAAAALQGFDGQKRDGREAWPPMERKGSCEQPGGAALLLVQGPSSGGWPNGPRQRCAARALARQVPP